MRFQSLVALLLLSTSTPADDTARRVRVALALAAQSCGACKTDEPACRAEAVKTKRPLVLFVGNCAACGVEVRKAGGIPCRVAKYDGDGKAATPRAVILTPKPAGGFWLTAIVPVERKTVLKAMAEAAAPAKGKRLDWNTGKS